VQATSESEQIAEITQKLIDDDLDILIELDAMMNHLHSPIMASKPAKHCISWAGFASPYLSQNNYFLGDRHFLPTEIESLYVEKLLRMPDSYVAISELASIPIDRDAVRSSMGIAPDQIVYLSISSGHKFNPDTAEAIARILQRVTESVFLHKGKGDLNIIKDAHYQACDRYHVNRDRIKFLPPRTKTEEEHRSTYQLADVLLDSYPYNSCTHSLEAFWQELPVVTIVGQQMFSRFGYSFFQTLGLQAGISWNWDQYVDWGERFGKDRELRESVRSHLQKLKQPETLCPLWNPRKFAQDLYKILLNL
jgi:predicted O-linked N-acetylglucosamine transferase (SPINDLY family)